MDDYYTKDLQLESGGKNKKRYFQSDLDEMDDRGLKNGKGKPPMSKVDYKSDKESTHLAMGSRILVSDTDGMQSTGSATKLRPNRPRNMASTDTNFYKPSREST